MTRPDWWEWELELTPHVEKRMVLRGFGEIELREMLDRQTHIRPDIEPGRWVVHTRHRQAAWEVILEPEPLTRKVLVITAYSVT